MLGSGVGKREITFWTIGGGVGSSILSTYLFGGDILQLGDSSDTIGAIGGKLLARLNWLSGLLGCSSAFLTNWLDARPITI